MRSLSQELTTSPESKGALIRHLMSKMPKNSLGLPEAIYRTDLVPESMPVPDIAPLISDGDQSSQAKPDVSSLPGRRDTSGEPRRPKGNGAVGSDLLDRDDSSAAGGLPDATPRSDNLSLAFLPLSYAEGYPTLPDGRPFWNRFDFEPAQAFQAFEAYMIQGDRGARQLFLLEQDKDLKATTIELLDWYDLYYWEPRSKAFDLFKIAESRKVRQIRALHTEDNHYMLSSRLMSILEAYMMPDDEGVSEFIEGLTPKAAIDLLKTLTTMQRVSAGLPAAGPSTSHPSDPGSGFGSIDVIMRNIAGNTAEGVKVVDEEGNTIEHLDNVLQDPNTAALAQELIIRLNTKAPPKQVT